MPSVASEVQNVLTARAQPPSNRSLSDTEARQPATAFAELLDSAAPAGDRRLARSDRADRTDCSSTSKAADDRSANAAAANDRADTKSSKDPNDSKDARNTTDARNAKAAKVAKDVSDVKDTLATGAKDAATASDAATVKDGREARKTDADQTVSADDKAEPDKDTSAALDATIGDVAQAVTIPQGPVAAPSELHLPTTGAVPNGVPNGEADALAALQATSLQPGVAKPAQVAGNGQGDAQGNAQGTQGNAPAEGLPVVDPQKMPQIEGSDAGQPHGNGELAAGGFRHGFANLIANADSARQTPGDGASAAKIGIDAIQSLGVATQANATNAAIGSVSTMATAPAPAQVAAVPLAGLAVEIATQATAGKNQFEIRLDPPELGRINVKLDIDLDGRVTSHLVVDRADTLDLLKRDAGDLQRALEQAGLKTSDNALEFSLRQQDFSRDDIPAQNTQQLIVPDDDPAPLDALRQGYGRLLGLGGGLDIRV